jgi:CheY-like chemotaxis protein
MSGNCVLIVDDEEDVRETVKDVVELTGCNALTAANGVEGLRVLRDASPCLVIVDLVMPGMSGGEMIETMKRDPALAAVPVVVSTSAPERAPRGVPVLAKPIDIKTLHSWIRQVCTCES